ncbi:MAG: hypothetical protein ABEJ68_04035 [Halobacteriaceae archaeon]
MTPKQLLAVGVAALLVTTGGALALGGNAPVSTPADDHANETAADHAGTADENGSAADGHADAAENGSAGPPVELPAQVPDFVSDIHSAINNHIENAVDNLGQTISDLTPGGNESTA